MRIPAQLFAVVLLAAATSSAADPPRIDARLRLAGKAMLPAGALGAVNAHGRVTVIARVTGGAARLRSLGFSARDGGADTAFVDVNRDELAALEALPGLLALERTHALHSLLDRSVPLTSADLVRASAGLDGHGVITGIVDTGLDFRHADFRTADGHTRVLAMLDLSTNRGTLHPELPDYAQGAIWLGADIDAQLAADANSTTPALPVSELDVDGHGTHVTGIAASDGNATALGLPAGRYVGMAPAASIVAAKAARDGHSFAEEDVLASVQFVFDSATRAGLPAVANLSLGGDGGPHDGSTSFERTLAALAPDDAPGRALVIAAGNAGSRDRHAGAFSLDGSVTMHATFPAGATAATALSFELWFDGTPPSLSLISPGGHTYGPVRPGTTADLTGGGEGQARFDVASLGPDSINGRYDVAVYLTGESNQAIAPGTWQLILTGKSGRWDAWITDAGTDSDPRFLDQLDADVRGDYPAYASSAISAGCFVSRSGWPTADGRTIDRGTVVGRASSFTATGPTADGRFFPDLAAPGDFVLSALSTAAPATDPASVFYVASDTGYLVGDDGLHGALRGTSQATPHVAGAIALLFQADPTLTPRRLRELLRTAADLDAGDPGYSVRFGFGRLDVARAYALLKRQSTTSLDATRSSVGASRDAAPPGAGTIISVVPRDSNGAPLGPDHTVMIEADGGSFTGPVTALGEGRFERTLIGDVAAGTMVTVTAIVDGATLSQQPAIWFVNQREDVGRPFSAAAGGCSLSHRAGAEGIFALCLCALLIAFKRGRRR